MIASLISLGCPKNLVDSEIVLGNLKNAGFEISQEIKDSDLLIINTCAFLKSAIEESYETINNALRNKRNGKKIIVTGCLVERFGSKLTKDFPKIDGFVRIGEFVKPLTNPAFAGLQRDGYQVNIIASGEKADWFLPTSSLPRIISTPKHYAYLKIADGCENRCSYCTLPDIRGPFRSRKIEDILIEAKNLAKIGVKELILVAQDTTEYGKDIYPQPMLDHLLRRLALLKEFVWIRLLYTHPAHFSQRLINTIKKIEKLRYLDIPLQHISDKILSRMNRQINRKGIERLLWELKKIDNLALRTTFIVGFPGESDKEFRELLAFVEDFEFTNLGSFIYSQEPGTPAYDYNRQIPQKIKLERYNALMSLQKKIVEKRLKGLVGKKIQVIIDGKKSEISSLGLGDGEKKTGDQKPVTDASRFGENFNEYQFIGRSVENAPEIDGLVYVKLQGGDLTPGDFLFVNVISYKDYDLFVLAKK